ncbi:MAG: HEAT repeat domain-containing protein [Acidimicrobiales bacterium]
MTTPSSAQRRRLVGVAGHTGDPATARGALSDENGPVRIAALRALERLGELDEAPLLAALVDPDPAVRIAALELAAPRDRPPIDRLLDDPDPMVVESAAWALGERADDTPAVIDALAAVAGRHEDPLAREAAVAALGAIGDDRGLPAVLQATQDKPAIRRRAVIALVAFEGPEVEAAWTRARNDRDRQVRDAVDELLGPVD